jgi:hypothetical protein
MRLKIAVSVVRFRPWAPSLSRPREITLEPRFSKLEQTEQLTARAASVPGQQLGHRIPDRLGIEAAGPAGFEYISEPPKQAAAHRAVERLAILIDDPAIPLFMLLALDQALATLPSSSSASHQRDHASRGDLAASRLSDANIAADPAMPATSKHLTPLLQIAGLPSASQ